MTKQNVIELVRVSPASIFTREDVVKLIDRIDVPAVDETVDVVEETADTVVEEVLEDEADVISFERSQLIEAIQSSIEGELNNLDISRGAEVSLSMDYDNHVSVEDIQFSFDDVIDDIMHDIEEWIKDNTKTEKA
jgi:hypothetical protein